jgi:hypothetical protein
VRKIIIPLIFVAAMLAGGSASAGQVSIGIQIGPPPRPRVLHVRPYQPGPGFVWVDGYWYPQGRRYQWRDGYWVRPPYPGARWVGPRYDGRRFYQGFWAGYNDRFDHGRRFDRDRDWDRNGRDRYRDRGRRDRR